MINLNTRICFSWRALPNICFCRDRSKIKNINSQIAKLCLHKIFLTYLEVCISVFIENKLLVVTKSNRKNSRHLVAYWEFLGCFSTLIWRYQYNYTPSFSNNPHKTFSKIIWKTRISRAQASMDQNISPFVLTH